MTAPEVSGASGVSGVQPATGGQGGRPRLLVVRHQDDCGPGRLAPHWSAVADLDVRRPDAGDALPATLDGLDGLVVLGGSMGAADDDAAPWLPATRRLLAAGVESGVPTLGICLGAQLLALATGGEVRPGPDGPETGLCPVLPLAAATDDPFAGPALGAGPVTVPQFHRDGVTRLPAGAELLARGERYPVQAFRLGTAAWGVQYHPEVTAEDFAGWVHEVPDTVRASGADPAEVLAAYRAAEPHLAGLAARHADAFAAVVAGTAAARATGRPAG